MGELDDLEKKIQQAKADNNDELTPEQKRNAENMSVGIRAGAELVSAIAGGALIGWLLDGWLDTKPWFLIVMLLLGVTTGFVNVYRISQNLGTAPGYSELHRRKKDAKTSPDLNNTEQDDE
jgi:ATP synthase protein I